MRRVKTMLMTEFEEVFERHWEPVVLVGDAVPGFMKRIPAHCFIASGQITSNTYYSSEAISGGRLVGGIDVYRKSPDDPVPLNKDWYAVVAPPPGSTFLWVDGPLKDSEHWLNEIPGRYAGAEIVRVSVKLVD